MGDTENLRRYFDLADRLEYEKDLTDEELGLVLLCDIPEFDGYLAGKARAVREKIYGTDVYIRGLIEFTNYCRNNCNYCGIRCGNDNIGRYRLSEDEMISCCDTGYDLGFRTFVLQGGEDPIFTDDVLVPVIKEIKQRHPDTAVTLSIGERSRKSYERLFDAGADRYLLRHETADREHYEMLHPQNMSYENRIRCLRDLRDIGYQVGCGMMIGSPGQTAEHLIKDIRFIQGFSPEMVGMGPFIPHRDTIYADRSPGTAAMTLRVLSVIRLLLPEVLLPATTALGTIDPAGREKALRAGANVVMPNLSPAGVREKYSLYDNKICTGEEAAECVRCLSERISSAGYRVAVSRGDHIRYSH